MTVAVRTLVLATAMLLVLGGAALAWEDGGGWVLVGIGVLLALSVLMEGRYRGAQDVQGGQWQRTGEREIDSETGDILEVWFDPQTGRRRYEPMGTFPPH